MSWESFIITQTIKIFFFFTRHFFFAPLWFFTGLVCSIQYVHHTAFSWLRRCCCVGIILKIIWIALTDGWLPVVYLSTKIPLVIDSLLSTTLKKICLGKVSLFYPRAEGKTFAVFVCYVKCFTLYLTHQYSLLFKGTWRVSDAFHLLLVH